MWVDKTDFFGKVFALSILGDEWATIYEDGDCLEGLGPESFNDILRRDTAPAKSLLERKEMVDSALNEWGDLILNEIKTNHSKSKKCDGV